VPVRRPATAAAPPTPGVRSTLDIDERRRQLVTLGTALFSSRTYDEVSIDEVARTAGISKGLLYHYFPTKRDFYVATVREAATQLMDRTKTPEQMDRLDRLRTGLDAFFDYVADHGPAYESLLRSGIGADAEVAKIIDETREAFCARLIEKLAVRDDLARIALRGWVGFVEASTLGWLAARDRVSRDAVRDMVIDVALDVLRSIASRTL
jgi:AcrR family transcriptional regulator